jgi:hypothetical protein
MKILKLKSLVRLVMFVGVVVFLSSCQRGYGCPYDFSVLTDFFAGILG